MGGWFPEESSPVAGHGGIGVVVLRRARLARLARLTRRAIGPLGVRGVHPGVGDRCREETPRSVPGPGLRCPALRRPSLVAVPVASGEAIIRGHRLSSV
jgi:hypothetical protein